MYRLIIAILCSFATCTGLLHSAEPRPLEIWISSLQDKVSHETMVRRYQETVDPDFRANVRAMGFREMPDKLIAAMKTGVNVPDIVQLDEVLFGVYLAGKPPFLDLTDRIRQSPIASGLVNQRLKLFSWKDRTYGVSQSLSAMVLYYRVDLFEKFGINAADLRTWDDFIAVGRKLAAKNQALTALDGTHFDALMRQRGADWFGPDGTLFPDEATALDTLHWMRRLVEQGIAIVPDRATIYDPVFFSEAVNTGRVLCLIGADWYGLDMMQHFSPQLGGKWRATALPAWTDDSGKPGRRTTTFAGQGLLIYEGTPMPETCWKFIEFMITDQESNVHRFVGGNSFPAFRPAWNDPRMHGPIGYFNDQKLGDLLMSLAPDIPEVVADPRRPEAIFLFQETYFTQVVEDRMVSPEEALEAIKAALNRPREGGDAP